MMWLEEPEDKKPKCLDDWVDLMVQAWMGACQAEKHQRRYQDIIVSLDAHRNDRDAAAQAFETAWFTEGLFLNDVGNVWEQMFATGDFQNITCDKVMNMARAKAFNILWQSRIKQHQNATKPKCRIRSAPCVYDAGRHATPGAGKIYAKMERNRRDIKRAQARIAFIRNGHHGPKPA